MITLINTSVKLRRKKPAIWVEGKKLAIGFKPHERYDLEMDSENKVARLVRREDGEFKVSVRNPRKTRNGQGVAVPLIECRDSRLLKIFELGASIRILIKDGVITIESHGHTALKEERRERFIHKVKNNIPLKIGSLFSGAGGLDKGIHTGLKSCGIDSYVKVAVEQSSNYIDALANQEELFRKDSILINSKIEDVEFKKSFTLDVVVAGIPCEGASQANTEIKQPELHPETGDAFFHYLNFVRAANPAILIIENVKAYADSLSWNVITNVLKVWGYKLNYTFLKGNQFGALENRERLVAVAVSDEILNFDFDRFVFPLKENESSLNDHIESVDDNDPVWKRYDYLTIKSERDRKANKGFKNRLHNGTEGYITTIRKEYAKAGSCEQFLMHKDYNENGLKRLFFSSEHAKFKGLPFKMIENISETVAHEICGQSVAYWVFVSVGFGLGLFSKLCSGLISDFNVIKKKAGELIDVNNLASNCVEFDPCIVQQYS